MKKALKSEEMVSSLVAILQEIPFISVQPEPLFLNDRSDVVLRIVSKDGTPTKIIVETKSSGQPRFVREAINQLYRIRAEYPGSYAIVAAPYISPESAELCNEEGIGYLDMAGNCRIAFDKIFIQREGAKNPFSEKRDLRSLYSPRSSRILRAFLNDPKRRWRIKQLAEEARVSIGQASNVKSLLKNREWLSEDENGFACSQPAELLAAWKETYTFRRNEIREFYSMAEIPEIESALAEMSENKKTAFALTGFSGAARLQPGIRYNRVWVYSASIDETDLARIGLKEVTSGSNVTLMVPYDEGVFYGLRDFSGIPVVSPVQVYLDLAGYKGRGEEAAQAIYERVLKPSWL